ncbi:hypothetical protein A9G13_09680 [Gilliamella sp. wkB178]|uniref:M48 family metalloprotease n=1 Tax=Gilliamella sp. wkB178 TaxID=3120259 RepID=UPI00080EC173|nr:M48 family metalloprotease [Gilliamella apicola]OCG06534.1 hypothetical protein A9G13_09680 [Gilliamella apicola]
MKYVFLPLLCWLIFLLTGCQNKNSNQPLLLSSEQIQALSEQDILAISEQACADFDKRAVIPSDSHALSQRLYSIAQTLPKSVNNIELNYKVYLDTEPNAWSTANGCIRVNSGLMKQLIDNELQAVLAHEQAHIALNHTISSFRQAPYIEITEKANETVIMMKEEISQQYEIDADDYAFNLLVSEKINPMGLINMLVKMPIHSVAQSTSHPSTLARINNILRKLNQE